MTGTTRLRTLVAFIGASAACGALVPRAVAQVAPRNVVLLIGDGMGTAQISALQLAKSRTNFSRFRVAGFSDTRSATAFVTESAAGATALSAARRTRNGSLAVDTLGRPLRTIAEAAHAAGVAAGVVVTSSVTHATPAAFLAHIDDREKAYDIARQIVRFRPEVLFGGGRKFFLPTGRGGGRKDDESLLDSLRISGVAVLDTIPTHRPPRTREVFLCADDGLPPATVPRVSLADMAARALADLALSRTGFFLMIEGSQIDWAGHDNDFPRLVAEMEDFDAAIGIALDFAARDGRTLVVVTADHETAGLALNGSDPRGTDMHASWAHHEHTASLVPVFAAGPGAESFGGIHRNDEIGAALFHALGLHPAP